MSVKIHTSGSVEIAEYTIQSELASVTILDYGCIVTKFILYTEKPIDIVLGYDNPFDYIDSIKNPYFGSFVGRSCNRTKEGRFRLNGTNYQLPINNGVNSLHGGVKGFDKRFWVAQILSATSIKFELESADGDEGYPGLILVSATYTLTGSSLSIETSASLIDDVVKETYVNLTNHPYFNLSGCKSKTIHDHRVLMDVKGTLELDDHQIPTGRVLNSKDAPELFFLSQQPFSNRLPKVLSGFDHYYLVKNQGDCIEIVNPTSDKVSLRVSTDCLGFQLYTGDWIEPQNSKAIHDCGYDKHSGFCVEASQPPNAINMKEYRQSVIITREKPWNHWTRYHAKF